MAIHIYIYIYIWYIYIYIYIWYIYIYDIYIYIYVQKEVLRDILAVSPPKLGIEVVDSLLLDHQIWSKDERSNLRQVELLLSSGIPSTRHFQDGNMMKHVTKTRQIQSTLDVTMTLAPASALRRALSSSWKSLSAMVCNSTILESIVRRSSMPDVEISRCRRRDWRWSLLILVFWHNELVVPVFHPSPPSHPTCSPLLIEFFLDHGFSFVLSKNSQRAKPRPIKKPLFGTDTEWSECQMGVPPYGFVWKCRVPLNLMVLLIIIPFLNGYFIGGIPYFQTNPYIETIRNPHIMDS